MVKPEKFLEPGDRDRIRDAVADAERSTAGEIRILVVGRSASRSWLIGALAGAVVGLGAWGLMRAASWGHPGLAEILLAGAAGLAVAFGAAMLVPPGRSAKDRAVWARAKREFARLGIAATEGATGVLLMISLYEHEAIVLADKAINAKVSPDTWPNEIKVIVDGIKSGRPADGIVTAVKEIGALLATHFPRRDDDRNELPDDVVLR